MAADNNIEQPSSSGITYAIITGNDMQNLAIDPLSGVVTTTRPLDREILERLMITVEAQGGGLIDTAVVSYYLGNQTKPVILVFKVLY